MEVALPLASALQKVIAGLHGARVMKKQADDLIQVLEEVCVDDFDPRMRVKVQETVLRMEQIANAISSSSIWTALRARFVQRVDVELDRLEKRLQTFMGIQNIRFNGRQSRRDAKRDLQTIREILHELPDGNLKSLIDLEDAEMEREIEASEMFEMFSLDNESNFMMDLLGQDDDLAGQPFLEDLRLVVPEMIQLLGFVETYQGIQKLKHVFKLTRQGLVEERVFDKIVQMFLKELDDKRSEGRGFILSKTFTAVKELDDKRSEGRGFILSKTFTAVWESIWPSIDKTSAEVQQKPVIEEDLFIIQNGVWKQVYCVLTATQIQLFQSPSHRQRHQPRTICTIGLTEDLDVRPVHTEKARLKKRPSIMEFIRGIVTQKKMVEEPHFKFILDGLGKDAAEHTFGFVHEGNRDFWVHVLKRVLSKLSEPQHPFFGPQRTAEEVREDEEKRREAYRRSIQTSPVDDAWVQRNNDEAKASVVRFLLSSEK